MQLVVTKSTGSWSSIRQASTIVCFDGFPFGTADLRLPNLQHDTGKILGAAEGSIRLLARVEDCGSRRDFALFYWSFFGMPYARTCAGTLTVWSRSESDEEDTSGDMRGSGLRTGAADSLAVSVAHQQSLYCCHSTPHAVARPYGVNR